MMKVQSLQGVNLTFGSCSTWWNRCRERNSHHLLTSIYCPLGALSGSVNASISAPHGSGLKLPQSPRALAFLSALQSSSRSIAQQPDPSEDPSRCHQFQHLAQSRSWWPRWLCPRSCDCSSCTPCPLSYFLLPYCFLSHFLLSHSFLSHFLLSHVLTHSPCLFSHSLTVPLVICFVFLLRAQSLCWAMDA